MPTDTGHGLGAMTAAAESLDLSNPATDDERAAAARTIARFGADKDDLVLLLDALALPRGEDEMALLFPLLPNPALEAPVPDPIGEPVMTADAHRAVALSMYRNGGYTLEEIREATDMDPAELAGHLAPADHTDQGPAPAVIDVPVTAKPQPATAPALVAGGSLTRDQEDLLAWGERHTSRTIQALAARTRTGLADLAQRRGSEIAAEQATAEVERLKAQLAEAEARLRQAKTGRIPTQTVQAVTAPTPIRPLSSAGLPREELTRIRAWARANGHEVADRGLIPRPVMEAWTNRDHQLAQAG